MRHVLSWRTRWRLYEQVRNSLWIVPALFVAVAIAMGLVLPQLDKSAETTIGLSFGPEAARSVLGALAGGMITFTGFVFSILLLAVQFGSSQFSPRMLRRFLRDPTTKIALGVFMATFIYALLVLREIGTAADEEFVPSNSVTIALALLLFSMVMFLRLISRTTSGLRVAAVLRDLGRDARRVVDRVYPEPLADGEAEAPPRQPDERPAREVAHGGEPGIIQSVDLRGLVEKAHGAGATIELAPRIGDLVAPGTPLFRVRGDGGEIADEWLRAAIAVGDERTMRQDPAFALRLLADISSRALSPGVNDPTTAIQALDQIELLLCQIAGRRLGPGERRDAAGEVRLTFPTPTWEDLISLALEETRQFGAGSTQVTRRLRALLEDLRALAPGARHEAIDAQLAHLDAAADSAFTIRGDRDSAAARDKQGLGAAARPNAGGGI